MGSDSKESRVSSSSKTTTEHETVPLTASTALAPQKTAIPLPTVFFNLGPSSSGLSGHKRLNKEISAPPLSYTSHSTLSSETKEITPPAKRQNSWRFAEGWTKKEYTGLAMLQTLVRQKENPEFERLTAAKADRHKKRGLSPSSAEVAAIFEPR